LQILVNRIMMSERRLWIFQPQHGRVIMAGPGTNAFDPNRHAVVMYYWNRREAKVIRAATGLQYE
jgi:hypothetical protein